MEINASNIEEQMIEKYKTIDGLKIIVEEKRSLNCKVNKLNKSPKVESVGGYLLSSTE